MGRSRIRARDAIVFILFCITIALLSFGAGYIAGAEKGLLFCVDVGMKFLDNSGIDLPKELGVDRSSFNSLVFTFKNNGAREMGLNYSLNGNYES